MKAIFDHKIIDILSFGLPLTDRGFEYGDGIFETMLARAGEVNLLKYHWERITEGARALSFRLPENFTLDYLRKSVRFLVNENKSEESARIKLMIWRKSGGRYEPTSEQTHFMLRTAGAARPDYKTFENVGVCESIRNHYSKWSFLKSMSALPYTMASLEKKEKLADDLLILDQDENVSEMLYSNVFWIKNRKIFTPALETGCVRGVMRSFLIDKLASQKAHVQEVRSDLPTMLDADHVFASNATGLISVTRILKNSFPEYPALNGLLP